MKRGEFVSKIKETGIDIRPFVAEQIRRYIEDHPKAKDSEFSAAGYVLNEVMRACEHVSRRKMLAESERSLSDDGRVSDYFENIVKSWGRMDDPSRRGKPRLAEDTFLWFFRHVEDTSYFTEVARHVWPNTSETFMRFVYAKCGGSGDADFKPLQTKFKADIEEVRREFRNLWIPESPRERTVRLGPVTISLNYEEGLRNLSLGNSTDDGYLVDGQPNVFKPLHWKSRLTPLLGRAEQRKELLNWALDVSAKSPMIILVSGPGGSGKTRLVADVVEELVSSYDWSGGFLPKGYRIGDVLDGTGNGVALIIDYPEERFDLIKNIIEAVADDEHYDRPIRIILASRESLEAWRSRFGHILVMGVEELRFDASQYLKLAEAHELTSAVAQSYPPKIGQPCVEFKGVKEWLQRDQSHLLPLISLAASVHAVHNPEQAFELDGEEVLLALADIELTRTRSYSERDFGDLYALEKLLALSTLTPEGLSKATIYELGGGLNLSIT